MKYDSIADAARDLNRKLYDFAGRTRSVDSETLIYNDLVRGANFMERYHGVNTIGYDGRVKIDGEAKKINIYLIRTKASDPVEIKVSSKR